MIPVVYHFSGVIPPFKKKSSNNNDKYDKPVGSLKISCPTNIETTNAELRSTINENKNASNYFILDKQSMEDQDKHKYFGSQKETIDEQCEPSPYDTMKGEEEQYSEIPDGVEEPYNTIEDANRRARGQGASDNVYNKVDNTFADYDHINARTPNKGGNRNDYDVAGAFQQRKATTGPDYDSFNNVAADADNSMVDGDYGSQQHLNYGQETSNYSKLNTVKHEQV